MIEGIDFRPRPVHVVHDSVQGFSICVQGRVCFLMYSSKVKLRIMSIHIRNTGFTSLALSVPKFPPCLSVHCGFFLWFLWPERRKVSTRVSTAHLLGCALTGFHSWGKVRRAERHNGQGCLGRPGGSVS